MGFLGGKSPQSIENLLQAWSTGRQAQQAGEARQAGAAPGWGQALFEVGLWLPASPVFNSAQHQRQMCPVILEVPCCRIGRVLGQIIMGCCAAALLQTLRVSITAPPTPPLPPLGLLLLALHNHHCCPGSLWPQELYRRGD